MANTIADKLTYLSATKNAILQAIIAKGVEVTDTDTFRSYADKISSIQTGGGGTVNLPDGTRFSYSKFTTVSDSIFPYLEQQDVMDSMFAYCTNLTTVPLFDTSNVNNMYYMFYGCKVLETVPQFNTVNVTDMGYMFSSCTKLTTVPQFNTVNVTNMSYMFSLCSKLQTVPLFDTSNVAYMNSMFNMCESLTSVPLFDINKVDNMRSMFYGCSSLANLGGFTGLKLSLDLSSSSKLTVDSVMNVINNAKDMTSSPRTLTLRQDVFNKLSKEQIATASAKGWNIAAK